MSKLSELKVGDSVILITAAGFKRVAKIQRETKTYFEVSGNLYSRRNGRLRGADLWNMITITPATEKQIEEWNQGQKKMKIVSKIIQHGLMALTLEQLEQITEWQERKGWG